MVSDRSFDNPQEFLLGCCAPNGELVEQLHHQASKSLKGARDANGRRYFDQDTPSRGNVYLESTCFVNGRVEQSEQALETSGQQRVLVERPFSDSLLVESRESYLMSDVRSGITDIPIHFSHDSNVLVAV